MEEDNTAEEDSCQQTVASCQLRATVRASSQQEAAEGTAEQEMAAGGSRNGVTETGKSLRVGTAAGCAVFAFCSYHIELFGVADLGD